VVIMEDKFNEYIEGLETHRWVGVTDLSEQFGVSERTVFQWLRDGKIEGVKWKNRRLINVPSVFGYLLKKKVIEVSQIKQQELKRELELKEFQK
jgi:predicted site-specific integrase-resolvase